MSLHGGRISLPAERKRTPMPSAKAHKLLAADERGFTLICFWPLTSAWFLNPRLSAFICGGLLSFVIESHRPAAGEAGIH